MKGIVTLCGSTRFYEMFDEIMLKLTLADYAVFTLGSHRGADNNLDPTVDAHQNQLAALHRRKILISTAIVVVNVGGYIGLHSTKEIDYARMFGVPVYWYELENLNPESPALQRILPEDRHYSELLEP